MVSCPVSCGGLRRGSCSLPSVSRRLSSSVDGGYPLSACCCPLASPTRLSPRPPSVSSYPHHPFIYLLSAVPPPIDPHHHRRRRCRHQHIEPRPHPRAPHPPPPRPHPQPPPRFRCCIICSFPSQPQPQAPPGPKPTVTHRPQLIPDSLSRGGGGLTSDTGI